MKPATLYKSSFQQLPLPANSSSDDALDGPFEWTEMFGISQPKPGEIITTPEMNMIDGRDGMSFYTQRKLDEW